jgi:hypothetical protein
MKPRKGTGAVSRHKTVPKPENSQGIESFMARRGACPGLTLIYKFVKEAGTKAKTVTSLLPQPSVLGLVLFLC